MTLGTGQFCTQPGLLFAVDTPETQNFLKLAGEKLQQKPAAPMLNPGICNAYSTGLQKLLKSNALLLIAQGSPTPKALRGQAAPLLVTNQPRSSPTPSYPRNSSAPHR